MKFVVIGVLFGALHLDAASVTAPPTSDWAVTGRLRFEQCEFHDAARAFSKALQFRPNDANLYFWLGKSYGRLAEVSGPFHASGNARRARQGLERAVELDPRNHDYLRELFDFYLDSPQWFRGGLDRAAVLIPKLAPDDQPQQAFLKVLLDDARNEYRGPDWRLRQATLVPANQLGRALP